MRVQEVAVETEDDNAYLMIPRMKIDGQLKVWVIYIATSKKYRRFLGDVMEVPPNVNPYPAVGDPIFEDGPIACKVHTIDAFINSARQGIHLGATGRMEDSPLQRIHNSLAEAGLVITADLPPEPPPTDLDVSRTETQ
jgi:hypothetical protein